MFTRSILKGDLLLGPADENVGGIFGPEADDDGDACGITFGSANDWVGGVIWDEALSESVSLLLLLLSLWLLTSKVSMLLVVEVDMVVSLRGYVFV